MPLKRAALLVLLLAGSARAQSSADDHLLAGAQYFREERYREALVEFRVADRMASDGGAAWYVASTLVKLKRPEEAIVAFARAEISAPADRDALLDYYHALACYDARLYGCADRLLAGLGGLAGPRIAAQARKIRADLAPLMSAVPSTGTIDWYQERARSAEKSGRPELAIAYHGETLRLSALRSDGYRRGEASASLRGLQIPRKSPQRATEKSQ